jgi:hypothetical protein
VETVAEEKTIIPSSLTLISDFFGTFALTFSCDISSLSLDPFLVKHFNGVGKIKSRIING